MSDKKVILTDEQVRKIAFLARLELTDAEVTRMATQLTDILEVFDVLNELNTENVKPTAQVTGLTNEFEEDEIRDFVDDKQRLLDCCNGEIVDDQIVVPSVFGS